MLLGESLPATSNSPNGGLLCHKRGVLLDAPMNKVNMTRQEKNLRKHFWKINGRNRMLMHSWLHQGEKEAAVLDLPPNFSRFSKCLQNIV